MQGGGAQMERPTDERTEKKIEKINKKLTDKNDDKKTYNYNIRTIAQLPELASEHERHYHGRLGRGR